MSELSNLPSVLALGTLLLASVVLTVLRPHLRPDVRRSTRFFAVVGATILIQALHFFEEWRSGFFIEFPEIFGLPPMSETVFVWFNLTWLVIWAVALFASRAGFVIALCPLWFLGLGMALNLVAHPALALSVGGYFPGLLTAPLVGVLGILVIGELVKATAPGGEA